MAIHNWSYMVSSILDANLHLNALPNRSRVKQTMDDIAKETSRQSLNEVNNVTDKTSNKQQAKQAGNQVGNQAGANVVRNVSNADNSNITGAKSKIPVGQNNPAHKDKKCFFCGIVGHISADCRKKIFA